MRNTDWSREIYTEGELDPQSTIRNFRIVQREGNREVSREQRVQRLVGNIQK
ncbi:hypothetical protein EPICR_70106 [Candidatus Desulfarcum epimagneticum]|uniref:Uncharacterized protein n=1 Tax=uncultured Desulfobacteraceae bacterium TaxID=218296 RepID=A0A484HJF9_9BACT|nr:hypothetical protein EPICR_70106 [uncultured Desulfobacteraceae bacterium]